MGTHFREAWIAVATARIEEFAFQAERLSDLAHEGVVDRAEAADVLHNIASAHSLADTFGADFIITIIADAFQGPAAVLSEAAE
jgi:hypothetical protein